MMRWWTAGGTVRTCCICPDTVGQEDTHRTSTCYRLGPGYIARTLIMTAGNGKNILCLKSNIIQIILCKNMYFQQFADILRQTFTLMY